MTETTFDDLRVGDLYLDRNHGLARVLRRKRAAGFQQLRASQVVREVGLVLRNCADGTVYRRIEAFDTHATIVRRETER